MDLLYCAMNDPKPCSLAAPDTFNSGEWLTNLANCGFDEANYLSYIGWQSSVALMSMVQDKDAFLPALRIVKKWAKQRGVYGFNFGYLNGISLIIMMLKAEQYLLFERIHTPKLT